MEQTQKTLEYKCPCCNAGLSFAPGSQKLTCSYCDNTFDLDTIVAYSEGQQQQEDRFQWEEETPPEWADTTKLHSFQCPSCGGEIVTEETTAASFCPFCDNPAIFPSRLSGVLKPDGVLPFQTTKEDAKQAFLRMCKGKPLLPKFFTSQQRLEKITGIYVPFWLYDCAGDLEGHYRATRVRHWSDQRYDYTKTDHFLLRRTASASFSGIPVDGSVKMEDDFMESIEPFDYQKLETFDTAYLTGFFADKYDVSADSGKERVRQRVRQSLQDEVQRTVTGYSTIVPTAEHMDISHSKAKYVLLPVWMLNTRYRGKLYTFAMNGQTGKITGALPISYQRAAGWFFVLFAGVSILATLLQWILL